MNVEKKDNQEVMDGEVNPGLKGDTGLPGRNGTDDIRGKPGKWGDKGELGLPGAK